MRDLNVEAGSVWMKAGIPSMLLFSDKTECGIKQGVTKFVVNERVTGVGGHTLSQDKDQLMLTL